MTIGCLGVYLVRILWLQGFPDQAIRSATDAVDEARESNHALSLCYALLGAAWTMLWVDDLAAAERYIVMLLDYSARLGWRCGVLGAAAFRRCSPSGATTSVPD
jgi:hypothetical protein